MLVRSTVWLAALALVGGCASAEVPSDRRRADASVGGRADAGRGQPPPPDAAPSDAAPDAEVDVSTDYLLVTEVMTRAFGGVTGTGAEFIEIWNPTERTFDLSVYYLADSQAYATLPAGDPQLDFETDFIARFPDGTSIGPGEVVVVAMNGEGFAEAYREPPPFAIAQPGEAAQMEIIALGAESDNVGLGNQGETVVLFHWDGQSNLVQDVDMVVAGVVEDPDSLNNVLDKTDLEVDGPADGVGTYRADAATMALVDNQVEARTASGRSYNRIALPGEHIIRRNGNGLTGHDATSEAIRETWESFADGRDYSEPTPGEVPGALRDEAEAQQAW